MEEDAFLRATQEVENPLYDPTAERAVPPPKKQEQGYKKQFEKLKENEEKYTIESREKYVQWWKNCMTGIGQENASKVYTFLTTGNGPCRKDPNFCSYDFQSCKPRYENFQEFLNLLDANGEWGKSLSAFFLTQPMPPMIVKESQGGSKTKSRNKRKTKSRNKRKTKSRSRRKTKSKSRSRSKSNK
jgi:hypothetical protein